MSTDHLARAKEYIAKGDGYYARAVDEIRSAQRQDPTLSYREIGERVGKSATWCSKLVQAATSDEALEAPFGGDYNAPSRKAGAKKVLREADDDTVTEIVAALPTEAVRRIAAKSTERIESERKATVERNEAREQADPERAALRRKQVVLDVNYELSTARVAIENGSADYAANENDFDAGERENLLRRLIGIRDAVNAFSVMVDTGDLGLVDEITEFLAEVAD